MSRQPHYQIVLKSTQIYGVFRTSLPNMEVLGIRHCRLHVAIRLIKVDHKQCVLSDIKEYSLHDHRCQFAVPMDMRNHLEILVSIIGIRAMMAN